MTNDVLLKMQTLSEYNTERHVTLLRNGILLVTQQKIIIVEMTQ